jgi:hypothetical protein
LDPCAPQHAEGKPCGKKRHEAELAKRHKESIWGQAEIAIETGDLHKAVALLLDICKKQQTEIEANRPDPRIAFIGG